MKKLILSLLLLVSFTSIYAQKANVSKAKSKAISETPDFNEARQLITPALEDESTKDDANTWYVAGLIGYNENNALDKQAYAAQTDPDMKVKENIVMESYNYFLKADQLDQMPNEKGKVKPRFRRDIKKMIKDYYDYNLIAIGAGLFDKREFQDSYKVFNTYLAIPDLPLMENSIQKDSTYSMIKYYAALAATNSDMSNEAIKLYEDLKDDNYETIAVYQLLTEEYGKAKDTVNMEKTLAEGAKLFPKEPWFLQKLINTYIEKEEYDKALNYISTAIQQEPNSAEYRFVEGGLKESLGNTDGAIESFQKAIELNPTMAGAYAELGRIHYNKAIEINDAADKIKDINQMKKEQEKAMAEFKRALPYYEQARKLEPEQNRHKALLRTLYYRLKMDKEYEAISKELGE